MRFICNKCGELIDEKEVIIKTDNSAIGFNLSFFHKRCLKEERE